MHSATLPDATVDPDSLQFADDPAAAGSGAEDCWRILLVDDEPDVHRATTFALAGLRILGKNLEFLHAHRADEASALLQREKDIAVVLLDVVMEREDAGLHLVRTIRNTLGLTDLRIILRTGQPGCAPEIETIHDYDINAYKTKSELTRSRLYATVTAALRAFSQIRARDELAFSDRLSALPNRNRFINLIDRKLAQGDCNEVQIAILDIDDFSEVNDALGHLQGDRLLQAVADRLTASLEPGTVLARIGSDTFGLMGTPLTVDPGHLLGLFRQPFAVQGNAMLVTATIGLARLLEVEESGRDALKDANIALKRAKKIQRGSYMMFSKDMGADSWERVRLLQGLRTAVDSERLFIVYQPQVSLQDIRVVGVEALLRWRNDEGVFVPPNRFITLAEASGLIVAIGHPVFMLETLTRIKQLGVSIATDDFGTGYSSLSPLRLMPADRLKIDRAFIIELGTRTSGGHIAAMVVELGRKLKMTVIAEGVENETQAAILAEMGCEEGQGYLYAKPLTSPDLKSWLQARAPTRPGVSNGTAAPAA